MIETIRTRLHSDWQGLVIVEATQSVVELASDYADTFASRRYDRIQLAAARTVQEAANEDLYFAYSDVRLEKSTRVLGMRTLTTT